MHYRKPLERPKRVKEIRLQRRPSLNTAPRSGRPRKIRVLFLCVHGMGTSPIAVRDFKKLLEKRGLTEKFELDYGGITPKDLPKACRKFDYFVPASEGICKKLLEVLKAEKVEKIPKMIVIGRGESEQEVLGRIQWGFSERLLEKLLERIESDQKLA